MLQKQEEHIPARGKGYIMKLSELDEFDLTNAVRPENTRNFDKEVRGTGIKSLPTSKTANKVEILKNIINKHNKKTVPDILQSIIESGDKSELELFRTLRLGPKFQLVLCQAVTELEMESKKRGETFIDHFIENKVPKENTFNTTQTTYLFLQWCKEQNIVPGQFLLALYCVLDKAIPKVNCFTLQGQSNAGKTYWTQPLMDNLDIVGQTIQSADFSFQNCVAKEIIQIPELKFTKPEQVEEAKKIFEGLTTMVNIKNKEPSRLERTPVILTCNQVPWTGFENERFALQNRMFAYFNLRESEVLNGLGEKGPDPRFYAEIFEFIRNEIANDVLWPPVIFSEYFHLSAEKINDKLNEIHDRTLTLEEHITNHVIKFRKEDGQLILPGEQRSQPMSDTLSKLDVTRYDTNDRNSSLSGKLLSWMSKLRDDENSDYYFEFTDYRKPKLFGSLTKMEYDPVSDIDESDFASFKHGYTIIQRVLLRTKYWPTCNPLHPSVEEKIQFMLRLCLEKMCSILLYIIKNTEHLKLNKNAIMGVMDEMKMDSGITMENTPIKGENSNRKRKLELDPNETQGSLMNNPMGPVFKPGPSGDNSDNSKSETESNESSPKRRKKTPVKK